MVSLVCSMAVILMCMCGQMLYNGVGVVSKGSGMKLNGPVNVGIAWNCVVWFSLAALH